MFIERDQLDKKISREVEIEQVKNNYYFKEMVSNGGSQSYEIKVFPDDFDFFLRRTVSKDILKKSMEWLDSKEKVSDVLHEVKTALFEDAVLGRVAETPFKKGVLIKDDDHNYWIDTGRGYIHLITQSQIDWENRTGSIILLEGLVQNNLPKKEDPVYNVAISQMEESSGLGENWFEGSLKLDLMMYGQVKRSTFAYDENGEKIVIGKTPTGRDKYKRVSKKVDLIKGKDDGIYPSVNRVYVRHGILSKMARDKVEEWELEAVAWMEDSGFEIIPEGTQFYADYEFYLPNDNRSRDTHNIFKINLDALEGIVYENDKDALVRTLSIKKVEKGEEPYMLITYRLVGE